MFYSQFILAKKGPLGTIWIAAHLERKLKKNQVADTDIGDSVDSILFPDVPIALRLSSHLLLGVVRIYSRKVNYLFHDCSEALLKVKQAFRSTAVDLPPEESTAPYHSITLPETFDLDDFELPDSALLNSNFDDRHVSSREQITLQDTLDGTGFSTSQFGLDERFGDGDGSQIGLDLDEELLDNNLKLQHDLVSYDDPHKGESDLAKMDIDETQLGGDEDRNNEASRELSELLCNDSEKHVISDVQNMKRFDDASHRLAFNIQTPDLNEVFLPDNHNGGPSGAHDMDIDFSAADPSPPEFNQFANFPSTTIPANCEELSSNPQENLPYTDIANGKLDKPVNQEVECPGATNKNLANATVTNPELDNIAQAVSFPASILDKPKSDSVAPQCSGGIFPSLHPVNDVHHIHNDSNDVATSGKLVSIESTDPKRLEVSQVLPSSTLVPPEAVPDSQVPPCSDGTVGDPRWIGFESTLRTTNNSHAGIVWNGANNLLGSADNGTPYDSNAAATSGKLVSIESTDPKRSEVSQVLPSCAIVLPEAVPDSQVPPCSRGTADNPLWVGFEATLRSTNNSHVGIVWNGANNLPGSGDNGTPYGSNDATTSVKLVSIESSDPKRSEVSRVLPSSTLVLPEAVPDSQLPPCSDGTADNPWRVGFESTLRTTNNSHTGIVWDGANNLPGHVDNGTSYDSNDAATRGKLVSIESTDPKQLEVSRVLPSSTLILPETVPDSQVPPCSVGTVDNPWRVGFESTLRSTSNSHAGIVWNGANNLPGSVDNGTPYDSNDAATRGKLVSIESTDPKRLEGSRVLPSSTLVLPEAIPNSQVPPCSDGTVDNLWRVGFESTLRTTNNSHGTPYEDHARLWNIDQSRVEEANFHQSKNFSALSSDFQMRSCTSVSNQANLGSAGDMLVEKTPGFSSRDQPCNLETPTVDLEMHFSRSSLGPRGPMVSNIESHLQSNDIRLGHPNYFSSSEFSEPERMLFAPSVNVNLSSDLGLHTIEKGSVDRISNLHGNKRRLLDNTPESQNGISPNMAGAPQKKQNTDYIIPKDDDLLASILVGRTPSLKIGPTPPLPKPSSKRPRLTQKVGLPKKRKVLLDDTIVLHADAIRQQLVNTEDIRRLRRKAPCTRPEIWRIQKSFIEEDSIFCESIFIGISDELNSLPRRYDPVQNMHAQANESIFIGISDKLNSLPRRYDPVHNMHAQANDSIFIGMSDELNSLPRRYVPVQNMHAQANVHPSSGEAIKEFEVSKSSPAVRENNGRETAVQSVVTERVDGDVQGTSGGESIYAESFQHAVSVDAQKQNMHAQANVHHSSSEAIKEFEVSKSSPTVRDNDSREIAMQGAVVTERVDGDVQGTSGGELICAESVQHVVTVNAQKQLESPFEVPFDSKIEGNSNNGLADAEHNSLSKEFHISHEIAEVNGTALHTAGLVSTEEFTSADCVAVNDGTSVQVEDLSNAKAASIAVEDTGGHIVNMTNLDCPQDERASMTKDNRDVASASKIDSFIVEVGAGFPEYSSTVIEHANISDVDVGLLSGDAVVDAEKAASEVPSGEMPNMVSFSVPPSTEGERVPSAVGENSCMNAEGGLDVESSPTRESSDFCSAIDDVDTDFLNVDDDADYDEETINDAPDAEEEQSLENSGWSSRTRGVARYLKTMFDQDSGRVRKSVAVDHLLAGKTRKEASRMFFETLVLKTRDYIHVEQDNPFDCINIKPRIKLLKTEF